MPQSICCSAQIPQGGVAVVAKTVSVDALDVLDSHPGELEDLSRRLLKDGVTAQLPELDSLEVGIVLVVLMFFFGSYLYQPSNGSIDDDPI